MPKNLIKVLACGMLAAGGTFAVHAQTPVNANQQVSACTGTVVDSEGEPIIGASVLVVGTTLGAATDFDGNFSIPNVKAGSTLHITSVGFSAVDVKWNGTPLHITLSEDAKLLDEVVAIGYGVQKKADLTGAVGVVSVDDAKKLPQTDVASMLQGQVPGVSVQTSSQPGASANVRIRGISSFNNVGPLYVVDGLIVNDAGNINPNEIESMQVLKDASAAAIYGARGANGVILITTKHGKSGKPTLDITANYSWQQMPSKIEMMDANQYMKYNELGYINAQIAWPAAAGGVAPGYILPNIDWQKAVFQTGFTQDYNLMYTQGSDNVRNAIGGGYLDQEGVIAGPKYKRATFRVNTDATYGILTVGENATFYYTESNPWQGGSFAGALQSPAVTPVYDEANVGGYGHGSSMFPHYITNPVGNQASVDARNTSYRLLGNIYAELKFLKHFTYKFNMGIDAVWNRGKSLSHYWSLRTNDDTTHKDLLSESANSRSTFLIENTLTWNQSFDKHNITALVGFTAEDVNWHNLSASTYDQQYDGLAQITLGTTQNNMAGSEEKRRMASWLGRVDYNYDSRYYLQVNFRSDACSKFGLANRRGNFPSFSAGWRPTQEEFWNDLAISHVVNNLKLRGSWGKIGDMQSLGNYSYQSTVSSYQPLIGLNNMWNWYGLLNNKIIPGALATTRVNNNLKWETKTTANVGLDFELLNSRLTGSFEWFTSTTSDLLYNINTAYATGTPSLWTNYGKMRNSGVEFNILWRDMAGEFTYSIGANIATVRNKVLRLGTTDLYDAGSSRTEVGHSISDFYLIPVDGIFQSKDEVYAHTTTLANGNTVVIQPTAEAGDIRYVDTNGDGQITQDDRVYAGSPLPKFEAGLTASLEWRGIDFNMMWTSRYGNKIYNSTRSGILATYVNSMPADYKPWTWDAPSDTDPRMYANASNNTMANTDRFLENGSFLRLKNLQLGYSIPQSISKRFGVQRLRMYVSGQNLWTITKYKGYDPEFASTNVFAQGYDNGAFPNARQYNVGLQVQF